MPQKTKDWVRMPFALLCDKHLTGDEIRLLGILLFMSNPIRDKAYRCWPSNTYLARMMGKTTRWVAKMLSRLEGKERGGRGNPYGRALIEREFEASGRRVIWLRFRAKGLLTPEELEERYPGGGA